MGQLQALQRLVESGNTANIELAREMVKSPALFKYRGVLRRCGMQVVDKLEHTPGQGLWQFLSQQESKRPCNCQSRVKCRCCERLVCKTHFVMEIGECTECGGKDTHHGIHTKPTDTYLKRMMERIHQSQGGERVSWGTNSWVDDYMKAWDNCQQDPNCQGVVMLKKRRSTYNPIMNYPLHPSEVFIVPEKPAKSAESREKEPVKHNPRPSRFGFLEGLPNHKRR